MARKPMTKSQIVSHFAEKYELSKKMTGAIIDEVAALGDLADQESGIVNHSRYWETG